jgi:hypothetical protein
MHRTRGVILEVATRHLEDVFGELAHDLTGVTIDGPF